MLLLDYWKDIPGFKRYQASYSGLLRHLGKVVERGRYKFDWQPERALLPYAAEGGYVGIKLSIDGQVSFKGVHVLVALAFIPNPDNLPEVNHINTNKLDNRACNLEWTTRKGNMEHAKKMGKLKGRPKKSPAKTVAGEESKILNP